MLENILCTEIAATAFSYVLFKCVAPRYSALVNAVIWPVSLPFFMLNQRLPSFGWTSRSGMSADDPDGDDPETLMRRNKSK